MGSQAVVPFSINIPDSAVDALHQKLSLTRWPDELEGAEWLYGSPLKEVKHLARYWNEQFDWRNAEKKLNDEHPQFTTKIPVDGFDELNIHFVWKKSGIREAVPLLFVHGWPGSFWEASKILNELSSDTEPRGPVFDVVVPSLPNYGFSEGPKKRGFGLPQYAEVCHKLMQKLGYPIYVTQGGDWGFYITRTIGLLYPDYCKASHINYPIATQPTIAKNPVLAMQHALTPYTAAEKKGLERQDWFLNEGRGYAVEQGTKPQTLGYALNDSPVALLSWIYEKLHDWTDSYPWTDDETCTWISIYWFSVAGPAANIRIYYEAVHPPPNSEARVIMRTTVQEWIPAVKLGIAYFPKDLRPIPKTWARTLGPVVYESDNKHGGHFAAWERPEIIIQDLRAMFGKGGGAYGLVPGRDGYGRDSRL